MPSTTEPERSRNLLFFTQPALWPTWPFLPLMRRRVGEEEECGLLFDAWRTAGLTGLSATVFLVNLFCIPHTDEVLLTLPREAYDQPEELFEAGWRVD